MDALRRDVLVLHKVSEPLLLDGGELGPYEAFCLRPVLTADHTLAALRPPILVDQFALRHDQLQDPFRTSALYMQVHGFVFMRPEQEQKTEVLMGTSKNLERMAHGFIFLPDEAR